MRSLADIAKSDEDSDDDDRNEYYAGGEKSGQVLADAFGAFGAVLIEFMQGPPGLMFRFFWPGTKVGW